MLAAPEEQPSEKKIVHLKSDNSGPVKPGDSVIFMVGNFAAQHNGAVITCDSAVRYSDAHIECFGNVLINKNTTYIYGDRADYDRDKNLLVIHSPLVKVVDGDATLYTRSFQFNTLDNVGQFANGGVLTQGDQVMEARRGYYYADTKELVAVEAVEMSNSEYDLKGDSVVYNMATEEAFFFTNTHIWNIDGEYLSGDQGRYRKADAHYAVTRNGYLLTKTQELWCDTLDYFRAEEHIVLRSNLQINESEHKNLSFGDYGEYWKESGKAFLTKRPAVINYDTEQNPDSLFMRSDSIYLYTLRLGDPLPDEYAEQRAAEAAAAAKAAQEAEEDADEEEDRPRTSGLKGLDRSQLPTIPNADALTAPHTTAEEKEESANEIETDSITTDSLAVDSLAADSIQLTPAEQRALAKKAAKEEAKQAAIARKAEKAKAKKELLEKIAIERQAKTTARLKAQERRDSIAHAKQVAKLREKMNRRYQARLRKGKVEPFDTTAVWNFRLGVLADIRRTDSLLDRHLDSLDSLRIAKQLATLGDTLPQDSIYRLVKGFRNVRIYRRDFQAVCDSLTGLSSDSTLHLYIEPVLWNANNQITSEVMDLYTANQQLSRAEFVGSPMMAAQFDTTYYDQIASKQMTAHFHNNEVYRLDAKTNVQTIFCHKDGWPEEVVGIATIESGDASFYLEDRQMVRIVYRINPVCPIYPVDQVPADVSIYLKGFKWQGDRRPEREDVFDRTIRPSERPQRTLIRRPAFPIRKRFDEERIRLTERGVWSDRNETLDPATVEWMRMLGFEPEQPREE